MTVKLTDLLCAGSLKLAMILNEVTAFRSFNGEVKLLLAEPNKRNGFLCDASVFDE